MRALSGAILTAVSTIMLGVVAVAAGARYQEAGPIRPDGPPGAVRFADVDTPLQIGAVASVVGILIGLGITFVGLAHHHHRRNQEFLRHHGYVPVAGVFGPTVRVTPAAPRPTPKAAPPARGSSKKSKKKRRK
jgi:hypothetical protein